MALSVELLCRMGRAKRVACMMMADRGYALAEGEADLEGESDLAVGARYAGVALAARCSLGVAMSGVYAAPGRPPLLLLFLDPNWDDARRREKMVSTDQVKAAIALWKEGHADAHCLLVAPSRLSPDAKKEAAAEGLSLLSHDFLAFPVGRHVMTPPHRALHPDEAAHFLAARKIELPQLPQLKASDAVALYYGFAPGTIVRITRPGGWEVYRAVVE